MLQRPSCSILPVATFSQFVLIVNYLRLKVVPDFLHLKLSTLIWLHIWWICHWRWKILRPPTVNLCWLSIICNWRWQIWEEPFNLLLYSGQQNTKHPEFYGEPDSGSPLKVCVYINCIFAEAWPSDIFPSDGHAAFYFMADYKVVTFDRRSRRPFLCPMETACFIQIVDCQAIRVFNVFPMALFCPMATLLFILWLIIR